MVWHRSLIRLAERADVAPALKKVWKKHFKVDGLVTQHVSPFEQHIVAPLLKELPGKASKKVRDFLIEAGPGLGLGVLIYWYGEKKHKDIAFHHRA